MRLGGAITSAILVTGGTGALGRLVVRRLRDVSPNIRPLRFRSRLRYWSRTETLSSRPERSLPCTTYHDLPTYVWALVLAGAIGIPAATTAVLYRGAIAAGISHRAATAVTAATAAELGGWLVVSGLLAGVGVYSLDPGDSVPWFLVAVAGALISLLLATRIPIVSRILADPGTPARLAVPHILRVVGVLFLIVMAQGYLPAAFALPAGLGDIAIGVSAPFVARRLARGTGRIGAVRFNVLGILDLIVAGIIGFLLLELVEVTPSTAPLTLLPLALIPTATVPLAVALHIVSLRRLLTAAKPEDDHAAHVSAAG